MTFRLCRRALLLALLTAALSAHPAAAEGCRESLITAYAAQDYPGLTASGIPTWPNVGGIVAGGGAYALGQVVEIEGLGSFVVADRGRLGWSQIDYLVGSHAEAVAWGRQTRMVCS